jgi:guanine deaminase
LLVLVRLYDPQNGEGVGNLDFFDLEQQDGGPEGASLTEEMVEKWWCVGDVRNRAGVWVQGREVYNNKTS